MGKKPIPPKKINIPSINNIKGSFEKYSKLFSPRFSGIISKPALLYADIPWNTLCHNASIQVIPSHNLSRVCHLRNSNNND